MAQNATEAVVWIRGAIFAARDQNDTAELRRIRDQLHRLWNLADDQIRFLNEGGN